MRKRLVVCLSLALSVSGCAQYSSRELTDASGKPIGLTWHGLRQTGDFASWQHTSVITNGKEVVKFATDRGVGIADPMLSAAGMVGAGYFIGGGIRKADGDFISQSQGQSQNGQKQNQVINNTLPAVQ